jgi:hypothetical protein
MPALSRRSGSIDSPRARDRRSCRIADEGAGDRADRPQHHGARHRAQRGITSPVLRKGHGGREQQDHGGCGQGFGHDVGPANVIGSTVFRLYGQTMKLHGQDGDASGSFSRERTLVESNWSRRVCKMA